MAAVWKPVVGWEGFYEVSSEGTVRSVPRVIHRKSRCGNPQETFWPGGELKLSRKGGKIPYYHVVLSAEGRRLTKTVHSIVCEAFHGPRPGGYDVAHFDGDGTNNRVSNLRWATRAENLADALRLGRRNRGERHGLATLTDAQALDILQSGESNTALAEKLHVNIQAVERIRRRKTWAHLEAAA